MVLKIVVIVLLYTGLCVGVNYFIVTPKPTTVLEGDYAVLECQVATTENLGLTVFWQTSPDREQITLATNRNTTDKYTILGGSGAGQYNLQVEDTDLSDDKSYQCAVYDGTDTTRSDAVRLEVVRPQATRFPQCFLSPRNSIDDGKTVMAHCVSGYPDNILSWNFNGRPVIGTTSKVAEFSYVEYIIHARYEDHGLKYTCYASLNNETCSVILDVRFKPRVTIEPLTPKYPQEDTARFTCLADGNPDAYAYRWEFGGTEISQAYSHHRFNHFSFEERGKVLVIPRLVLADNNVVIMCEATNELGSNSAYTRIYIRGTTLTMETLGPIIVGCICGVLIIILLIWSCWYCCCDCGGRRERRRRPPPDVTANLPNLRSAGYGPETSGYLRYGRTNRAVDNTTELDSNNVIEMNETRTPMANNNPYVTHEAVSTPPANRDRLGSEIRKTYKNLDIGDDDVAHSGSYDVNPDPEGGMPKEID